MDHFHPNRFPHHRHRKPIIAADRILAIPPYSPPLNPAVTVELLEDDVVFGTEFCSQRAIRQSYNNNSPSSSSSASASVSSSSSSASTTPIHPHSFGILAALPDHETHNRSISKRYRKSASTRVIPSMPKAPARDRIHAWLSSSYSSSSSSARCHQSLPVNVPELPEAVLMAQRRRLDEEEEESEEVFPPHEVVARNSAKRSVRSPVLAYSVMEGAGRTLKGRDMRQVRNAILQQTDFQ